MANTTTSANDHQFGFGESQNISYPINFNNFSELLNITIPEELPNITRKDITDKNEDLVINRDFILKVDGYLQKLLNEVPLYQIPPLFNAQTLFRQSKTQQDYAHQAINSSQFKYQLQQQTTPPPQPQPQQLQNVASIPQQQYKQEIPILSPLLVQQQQQQHQQPQIFLPLKQQYCI